MPTATINNPNEAVRVVVIGLDDPETSVLPVTGNVTISDYVHAYVAKGGPGEFFVKAKAAVFPSTPGSSLSVLVNFNCADSLGAPIPTLPLTVVLMGPPVPVATHLKFSEGPSVSNGFGVPADPGSATITF